MKIANKSKILIALFIISLIPLILSLLNYVNNTYLFVGLFALNFLIVGIVSTMAMNPQLSFKEAVRKIVYILPFGLVFSIISAGIVYYMKMTASSTLVFLSIFTILMILIAYVRNKSSIIRNENPEEYNEKYLTRLIYTLAIFCIISYIGMEVPPFSTIPLWFGLCVPFIFLLPGYLILNIVNPYKDAIRSPERIGISIFISLLLTSSIGLILVQIEHSLNMRHVTLVLAVITLVILLPLYYIKIKEKKTQVLFSDYRLNRIFILMTLIGFIAVVASGVLVSTGNINNISSNPGSLFQGNTTFNVTGIHENPSKDGYYNFDSGEELNLSINILNNENRDMKYKLKIEIINDTTNETFDEKVIDIKNKKEKKIKLNLTMTPGKKDIRFTLYNDKNEPYKIRHLYVNVNETSDLNNETE